MLKNHIKIAWRQLTKHKAYSAINIAGLALSLSAFWAIALFVADELSYDRYHEKAERIYRVVSHGKYNGGSFDITGTSGPVAQNLKQEFPEIEQAVRINAEGGGNIAYKDKKLKQDDILMTDNSFFAVFTHHFLAGDPATALSKPQAIVLTKTLAEKLFGSADAALNKTINFENNYPNLVTGVMDDVPQNSHFTFSALRSFPKNYNPDMGNFSLYTYLLLKPNTESSTLQAKLPRFVHKYLAEVTKEIQYKLELQPLTSIHLHSNLSYELGTNHSIKYIYVLCTVGLLVLIIAFINYINITTARASVRLREVAVRKIVGSDRKNLISLFLSESLLIILISATVSVLLITLLMPYFNLLTGKNLGIWRFGIAETISALLVFSMLCGLIGGLYPALFLSGFKTIPSLKNQMGSQQGQILFRKSLVVFQFTVTVVMIAVSVVIYSQLDFVSKKDLGFNKNQVLTFHLDEQKMRGNIPALRNALLQNTQIKDVASAGNPIGNNNIGQLDYGVEQNGAINGDMHNLGFGLLVDENFIPTMQMRLVQGRNFMSSMPTDSGRSVIVNEALVRKAGWKNAIGKQVQTGFKKVKTVVGVVKDFHIYSLQHKIEPMLLQLPVDVNDKDNVYVRIGGGDMRQSVKFIEKTLRRFDAEASFDYHFLDQNFQKQYAAEEKQGQILLAFTTLTIGIACLGLFALITFTAEQRVKEIGIRKVLGATVVGLVRLLSADLMKLVIISMLIASPIAWFAMHKWLEDFAYRIEVSWWMFVAAGCTALTIAVFTISFQAVKAALANPVKSLRTE